jgi:hypothetical protein
MTYATFSSENIIGKILKELDLSIALFATYQHATSISAATIERSLAGKRRFDPRLEAEPLESLAKELRAFANSFEFRPDWRDVSNIRAVLARRREQQSAEQAALNRQERIADIESMSDEDLRILQEQMG